MEKKKLLIKLISGNIGLVQKEKLLAEIEDDKQLRKEYETIKNAWALSSIDQDMDVLKIEKSYLSFKRKKINRKGHASIFNLLKYAAIIIVFFTLGIFTKQLIFKSPSRTPLALSEYNQITVPNGDKAELTLSDGSKVWLNAGTTLEFPRTFDKSIRKVYISGEAFFKVKKRITPFIVSSNFGDIEVLGTSFNVRAYDNLKFQTTLEQGKIHFKNSFGEKILNPGQQLTYSEKNELIVNQVNPEYSSSWKIGIVSFENEPLEAVMKKLERHFDIKIILDEKIAQIRFTGRIYDETINEVMIYINKTKPLNYNYDKKLKTLVITSTN